LQPFRKGAEQCEKRERESTGTRKYFEQILEGQYDEYSISFGGIYSF